MWTTPTRTDASPASCSCGAARVPRQAFSVQPRIERTATAPDIGRAARLGHRYPSPRSADLAPAGAGRPLPEPLREKMETAFGHDFSSVRVHEDAKAASVRAVAFTRGENIHFRPGRFQRAGRAGTELLAHELAHVVQQRQGRVAAPPAEAPVQEVPVLENEAERAGRAAAVGGRVRGATAAAAAPQAKGGAAAQPAVQRVALPEDPAMGPGGRPPIRPIPAMRRAHFALRLDAARQRRRRAQPPGQVQNMIAALGGNLNRRLFRGA